MMKLRVLATAVFTGALAFSTLNLGFFVPAASADAHEFKKGSLMIDHPFARANIAERPAAAYAKVMNMGSEDDRLISASSPVAGRVELHTHIMENGIAKMRPVETIEVPAGGSAELKPGGDHIMLFDLAEPLKKGDKFPLTLTFEKAGDVEVTVNVEALGSAMKHGDHKNHGEGAKHGDHSGHGDHGKTKSN